MRRQALMFMFLPVLAGYAQNSGNGNGKGNGEVLVPESSIEQPDDIGKKAHTNHVIGLKGSKNSNTAPSGLTPAQAAKAYGITNPSQTGGTIVIVDAFHYPTAANDLAVFSQRFGLPAANFTVKYATPDGLPPRTNCGWAQEAALDIQWAHAMSPKAPIVLIEAASNSMSDLMAAVDMANAVTGVRQVSMSWGGSEYAGETAADAHFGSGIIYFASSGDIGGKTNYPGTSPYVVAAGGTTLNVKSDGTRISETGWSGSGGGPSQYEPIPLYQSAVPSVAALTGQYRGTPDFSFDADPNTGVSVYDSTVCQGMSGWMVFGGTSVSAPALAGIVNAAGGGKNGTFAELTQIYSNLGTASFFDITSGKAGSYFAKSGWDFVTGVGSNNGMNGK